MVQEAAQFRSLINLSEIEDLCASEKESKEKRKKGKQRTVEERGERRKEWVCGQAKKVDTKIPN